MNAKSCDSCASTAGHLPRSCFVVGSKLRQAKICVHTQLCSVQNRGNKNIDIYFHYDYFTNKDGFIKTEISNNLCGVS